MHIRYDWFDWYKNDIIAMNRIGDCRVYVEINVEL